jgi:hypothetical protein
VSIALVMVGVWLWRDGGANAHPGANEKGVSETLHRSGPHGARSQPTPALTREPKTARPEDDYRDKQVRVTGLVKEYKGKPEIVVSDPSQIEIVNP